MARFRCPQCCCGPAIVLHPPAGSTPICRRCGSVLERQPWVRPLPALVLLAVGSALVALSIPAVLEPHDRQDIHPDVKIESTLLT